MNEIIDTLIEKIAEKVAEKIVERWNKGKFVPNIPWIDNFPKNPQPFVTVMYGVRTDDIIWNDASSQADTISTEISSANYKKE